LTALFNPTSGAVRDTNGDGIPDTIAARVIVPASPAHEDVEGAATIAGRLGYETSAMTLPVVVRDTDVVSGRHRSADSGRPGTSS